METPIRDRQARSRSAFIAYFIGLALLFFVGVTAGIWVSIRYFDTPIAVEPVPDTRTPGRITGGFPVPSWLDHPYRRRENPFLTDYSYRAAMSDLNRIFFGEALASVPEEDSALAQEYQSRRARGLINADDERVYHERFDAESRAALNRVGRIQGYRAMGEAKDIEHRESLSALRVPGTVLYLAAAALAGRPVRARLGSGTVIRTQTVSKDDYRIQIDHDVTDFGLGVGSAYDSVDRRRSVTIRQALSPEWAVGVDRTISSVAERSENVIHLQFVAPF